MCVRNFPPSAFAFRLIMSFRRLRINPVQLLDSIANASDNYVVQPANWNAEQGGYYQPPKCLLQTHEIRTTEQTQPAIHPSTTQVFRSLSLFRPGVQMRRGFSVEVCCQTPSNISKNYSSYKAHTHTLGANKTIGLNQIFRSFSFCVEDYASGKVE